MSAITRTVTRQSTLEVRLTRDRQVLRDFLDHDRLYAAYALCDLDDREFGRTRWGVALEGRRPVAVAMEYAGMTPQPLFVMGTEDGIEAVLRDVIKPRVAYLAAPTGLLGAVEDIYRVEPGPPMVRMWVDSSTFRPAPGAAVRLVPADIGDLDRLYDLGMTSWLPAESVANGVYYGVRIGGRLIAAAGTHVVSREVGLAAVGNVLTHRDYRGRGHGKVVTGAVTAELLRFVDQVILNVRSDNPPAMAAYRALGYQEHTRFEERLVRRRGSVWDTIAAPLRRFIPTPRRPS